MVLSKSDLLRERLAPVLAKAAERMPVLAELEELPGIGPGYARAIMDFYATPEKVRDVIQNDPWRLARDIEGIGFKKADDIAMAGGMRLDCDPRVEAGVVHAIDETDGGHCYTNRVDLTRAAVALLGVDAALVSAAVGRLLDQGRVIIETLPDGPEAVYASTMYETERSVARMLAEIVATNESMPVKQFSIFRTARKSLAEACDEACATFQKRAGYPLSEEQVAAVKRIVSDKVIVITGGPGTGKTTILRAIVDALRIAGLRHEIAAPTGRAAKRMREATGASAKTIHRMLGFKPGKGPTFKRTNPLPVDAVVLDETSMVDIRLMKNVLDAIPSASRLILIGDTDQLPSVGPGAVLRDVIASEVVPVVRLAQVFRQAKGSRISVNAQRINAGQSPEGEQGAGGEFYVFQGVMSKTTADIVVDLVTRKLPASFGLDAVNDVQVLCPTKLGPDGVHELNKRLRDLLNPSGASLFGFRVSDKVSHVDHNDYDNDVMNGDVGFVSHIDRGECHFHRPMSRSPAGHCMCKLFVRYDDKDPVAYDAKTVKRLTLAYAITVHKSQGGEYKAVVMPALASRGLSRNMLYTGVTRGKSVVCLVSNNDAIASALAEVRKDPRKTRLAERLRSACAP